MRTGTKVSIAIVVWTMSLVSFLVVVPILLWAQNPELDIRELWGQVAPIITALLGAGGLGFGVVEIRKVFENTSLERTKSLFKTLGKGETDEKE